MTINFIDAIYKLYPQTVRTEELDAYDKDGKKVDYDKSAIDSYIQEQQTVETAAQQAAVAAKESALSKLTALGLTADEVKALLGVA